MLTRAMSFDETKRKQLNNNSISRTEHDSSEESSADDVECLVRVALETLPNLRKLENVEDFGDFKGNWAVELPLEVLSTVDCLTGLW